MIWITLLSSDISYATKVGTRRQDDAIRTRAVDKNNRRCSYAEDLKNHQLAAIAEYAAHLVLGTSHWNMFGPGKPDLDGFIDVKDRRKSYHKLIVQFDAKPEWAYLSVNSEMLPTFCIEKWCWGWEAKQDRFRADPVGQRPAYFVPMSDRIMRDVGELFPIIKERNEPRNATGNRTGSLVHRVSP